MRVVSASLSPLLTLEGVGLELLRRAESLFLSCSALQSEMLLWQTADPVDVIISTRGILLSATTKFHKVEGHKYSPVSHANRNRQ